MFKSDLGRGVCQTRATPTCFLPFYAFLFVLAGLLLPLGLYRCHLSSTVVLSPGLNSMSGPNTVYNLFHFLCVYNGRVDGLPGVLR